MKSRRKRLLLGLLVPCTIVLLLLAANPGYYLGSAYSGELCANCHAIRPSVESWKTSSHRAVACQDCHGSALSLNLEDQETHWTRLYLQVSNQVPNRILLRDRHVDRLVDRCAKCHQAAFSGWKSSGHSVKYSDIFLNPKQNRSTLLNADCVRCHGMFYDRGDVAGMVSPINLEGPWAFADPAMAGRPAIPCLACHRIHTPGTPAVEPDYAVPSGIASSRDSRLTTLAFYDQREQAYRLIADLPLPKMAESGTRVKMSPDRRQTLCYQCHAPRATFEVGTDDDRTGIGVHEGISCLGCHFSHSQDARDSCKTCHPKMSNCGLDVERMDTTFRSPTSRHNIHFVKCQDCHPNDSRMVKRERIAARPSRP